MSRFANAEALTSWAGLAPRHRESDTKVVRGPITKAGSKLVRWAAIEAVTGRRGGTKLQADFDAIAARRGKYKARAAVARKLLTLVYLRPARRRDPLPCQRSSVSSVPSRARAAYRHDPTLRGAGRVSA